MAFNLESFQAPLQCAHTAKRWHLINTGTCMFDKTHSSNVQNYLFSFIYLFIYFFIHLLIYLFISFIYSFTYLFIYSFISYPSVQYQFMDSQTSNYNNNYNNNAVLHNKLHNILLIISFYRQIIQIIRTC